MTGVAKCSFSPEKGAKYFAESRPSCRMSACPFVCLTQEALRVD